MTNTPRPSKRATGHLLGALAVAAFLAASPLPAFANQIVTFAASGVFDDGATLGGTYMVDVTTGVPVGIDMTFSAPVSSDVTILDGNFTDISGNLGQFAINNLIGPNFYPGLTFILDVPTLVGYGGGQISGGLYLDNNDTSQFTALTQGSLSAVPTPATLTLPLFATGLGALGLLGWYGKRKKPSAVAVA